MAITKVQDLGAANSKTTGSTVAVAFSGGTKPAVGELVVVSCARDDIASDPLTGDSVSDGQGNTYWRIAGGSTTGVDATLQNGVNVIVFWCVLSATWAAGTNTVTWTHPSITTGARGMRVEHFAPSAGKAFSVRGLPVIAQSTTGVPTATTASLTTGDLAFGALGVEGTTATAPTGDADTSNGSWSTITAASGTTGSTANTNIYVATQYKVVTGAATQTWNPTVNVSTDAAVIVQVFREFTPGAKAATFTDTFTTLDTGVWDTSDASSASVGGLLQLSITTGYLGIKSLVTNWDLQASTMAIRTFADGGDMGGANTRTVYFELRDAADPGANSFNIYRQGAGDLNCEYYVNGVFTLGAYPASTDSYWRFREAAGTLYWETSADGSSWTNRLSTAVLGFSVREMYVFIYTHRSGAESDPYYVYLDNLNVAPASSATATAATVSATANNLRVGLVPTAATVSTTTNNETGPARATTAATASATAYNPSGTRTQTAATVSATAYNLGVSIGLGTATVSTTAPAVDDLARTLPVATTAALVANPPSSTRTTTAATVAVAASPFAGTSYANLLFDSGRTGNFELYRVDTSGTVTQLTSNATYDSWWPRRSPDGTKIVFVRTPAGVHDSDYTQVSTWTCNADGSSPTQILAVGVDGWALQGHPAWKPDGTKIVTMGGAINLYTCNPDGSGRTQVVVTGQSGSFVDPQWSPDGTLIIYCYAAAVYAVSAAGGSPVALTDATNPDNDPVISPDATMLAYLTHSSGTSTANWDIRLLDLPGATGDRALIADGAINSRPEWAPDSASIYFHRTAAGGASPFTLWKITVPGGVLTQIATPGGTDAEYPALDLAPVTAAAATVPVTANNLTVVAAHSLGTATAALTANNLAGTRTALAATAATTASNLSVPAPTSGSDSFTGTNGDPWAAPWVTTTGGAGNIIDIQSNRGRIRTSSTSGTYFSGRAIYATGITDIDVTATFQASSNNDVYFNIIVRGDAWNNGFDAPSNGYQFYADIVSDTINLARQASNVATSVASAAFVMFSNTDYKFRVKATGTTLQAKAWLASGSEPGTWGFTVTDATYASGFWGVAASSGTATSVDVFVDDVTFTYAGIILGTATVATAASNPSGTRTTVAATVAATANNLTATSPASVTLGTATIAATAANPADALTLAAATTALTASNLPGSATLTAATTTLTAFDLVATSSSSATLAVATATTTASGLTGTRSTAAAAVTTTANNPTVSGTAVTANLGTATVAVTGINAVAVALGARGLGSGHTPATATATTAAANEVRGRPVTAATATTTANPFAQTRTATLAAATVAVTGLSFDAVVLGAETLGSGRTPVPATSSVVASPFSFTDQITLLQALVTVTAAPFGHGGVTLAAAQVATAASNLADALTAQAAAATLTAGNVTAGGSTLQAAALATVAYNLVPLLRNLAAATVTLAANPLAVTSSTLTAATAALTAGQLAFNQLTLPAATAATTANPFSVGEALAAASIATLAYNLGALGGGTLTAASVTAQANNLFLNPTSSLAPAAVTVDAYALTAINALGSALLNLAAQPLSGTLQSTAAQTSLLAADLIGLRTAALSFGVATLTAYGLTTLSLGQSLLAYAPASITTFNLMPLVLASTGLALADFGAEPLIHHDAAEGAQATATTTAGPLSGNRTVTPILVDITGYGLTTLSLANSPVGSAVASLTAYNLNNGVPVGPNIVNWLVLTDVVDNQILTEIVEPQGADLVLVEVL